MRLFDLFSRILPLTLVLMVFAVTQAHAVNPDEILDDPVLEERARDLSGKIRCMKCQNQSIDDSDAALARDLRILVRDRLVKGDSDQQVLDYLVDRYGEFVLLQPRFSLSNLFLWLGPIFALLVGLFLSYRMISGRRKGREAASNELSKAEHDKLTKILGDRD